MPDLEDKKNASVEIMHKAIFAAGCFWGVEKKFSEIIGEDANYDEDGEADVDKLFS